MRMFVLRQFHCVGEGNKPVTDTVRAVSASLHGEIVAGEYLKFYDPDGAGGRGIADWTNNQNEALLFATAASALECWRQQSTVMPYRNDGKPNRPLTHFSVTIDTVQLVAMPPAGSVVVERHSHE